MKCGSGGLAVHLLLKFVYCTWYVYIQLILCKLSMCSNVSEMLQLTTTRDIMAQSNYSVCNNVSVVNNLCSCITITAVVILCYRLELQVSAEL